MSTIYGRPHREARAAVRPDVEAGLTHCAEVMCLEELDGYSRWIPGDADWDLAHDRTEPGTYLGPAHRRCNRAEGARFALGRDDLDLLDEGPLDPSADTRWRL